jgi:DNA polymerase-1
MIAVQEGIDRAQRKTKVIMQVHDELVFEVLEDEVEWLKVAVPKWMADVAELKVPLLAEVGVGVNWDQAH